MSNCIELMDSIKRLTSDDIDLETFKTAWEMNKDKKDDLKGPLNYFYWFLSRNVEFSEKEVKIHFGKGRSSHCWRDFEGTLREIAYYLKKSIEWTFRVADEYDGFETSFDWKVQLNPPLIEKGA